MKVKRLERFVLVLNPLKTQKKVFKQVRNTDLTQYGESPLLNQTCSGFKVKWKVSSQRFCMQVKYRSGLNTSR